MNGEVVSPSLLAKIDWEKLVSLQFSLGMAEFVDYSSCRKGAKVALNSSTLRNYYECTSYVLYTAFKVSSRVVMDGQAGTEECIELESAMPGGIPGPAAC